jgi:hypothetical protein
MRSIERPRTPRAANARLRVIPARSTAQLTQLPTPYAPLRFVLSSAQPVGLPASLFLLRRVPC